MFARERVSVLEGKGREMGGGGVSSVNGSRGEGKRYVGLFTKDGGRVSERENERAVTLGVCGQI